MAARPSLMSALHHRTVLIRLWLAVLLLAAYASVSVYLEIRLNIDLQAPPSLVTVLGMVMGMLLVFRTNSAYDRWWEGRKLWGALINDCRNLALKCSLLAHVSVEERREMLQALAAFPRHLARHLQARARWSDEEPEPDHAPLREAEGLHQRVRAWRSREWLDPFDFLALERNLNALLDITGGCERIQSTPLVRSYLNYVRQCLLLYLLVLPWALPASALAVLVTTVLAYLMVGLELVAEEVEDPFGVGPDDLPLGRLCGVVEESIEEVSRRMVSARTGGPPPGPGARTSTAGAPGAPG